MAGGWLLHDSCAIFSNPPADAAADDDVGGDDDDEEELHNPLDQASFIVIFSEYIQLHLYHDLPVPLSSWSVVIIMSNF